MKNLFLFAIVVWPWAVVAQTAKIRIVMDSGGITSQLMRELQVANMRWPGGNYVAGYTWQDGIRHADFVKMANFTLMTSLLGRDGQKGTFKTPLFYTFKAFSTNCRGRSVDTYVSCDTFNTARYKGIPFLDVTAVYVKETNTVFINVVNRHKDKSIRAEMLGISGQLGGQAEARIITADDLKEPFAFDKQTQYRPAVRSIRIEGGQLSFDFPPHSYTQIKASIQ